MNKILYIEKNSSVIQSLTVLIKKLHADGPIHNDLIEDITYYKIFHPKDFSFLKIKLLLSWAFL
jgi:hypothetical protein